MNTQKLTVNLPEEQADYIDSLIKSGTYASRSDVVQAGLSALKDRDGSIEQWLRKEVVPIAAAMQENPASALSADKVFDELRTLHRHQAAMHRR